jgi:hypothetical protein
MKKINHSPTADINFNKNLSYNDNFADWLTEMVDHWTKHYTGCTFEIRQVGTEGTQVEIEPKTKQNINLNCSDSLNTDLSKINKITYTKKASESSTYYVVTWKTESKTTPKKDSSNPKKKAKEDEGDEEQSQSLQRLFNPIATQVVSAITKGVKGEGVTGEHKIDKKLLEEIDRIKELLK